jgi:hypothetical protein
MVDPQNNPCLDGNFVWPSDANDRVLRFTPYEILNKGTIYQLTIDTNATDPNMIKMPEAFTLRFSTEVSRRSLLTFTGESCFVRTAERKDRGVLGIFERIKAWIRIWSKNRIGDKL